ncbi:MAG: cation-transporting P-type ATPase, partial [Gammaproteobacteria bacterium]
MVSGGAGRGVVVATALATELGRIQSLVTTAETPETPMQRQLREMGTQLALLSGAVCIGVFAIGLLRGQGWLLMLKSSVSLAVAAVPEGLPAVATTTLALGIKEMRKRKVAVRHLDAVENLGAVQVFCLDKTGTLTLNHMTVTAVYAGGRRLAIRDGLFHESDQVIDPLASRELQRLLETVSLCSETRVEEVDGALDLQGSATENALVEMAISAELDILSLRRKYTQLDLVQRAEGRPMMASVHALGKERRLVAVKGSPAEVLALCSHVLKGGRRMILKQPQRKAILLENERMASDALRVLGVAFAERAPDEEILDGNLVWLGLVGMADPLRAGMPELMQTYHRAGIRTVMITGDQSATAYAIGKQLGLSRDGPIEILDSASLDKLDPQLLAGLVRKVDVFARVSPAHKLRIVQALQAAGYVVAMTGDGINDGPALKAADIGVAMGATGTDVARSVADVVLEDDNLHTMTRAVSGGRTIYDNVRKTIQFMVSTNVSEIEIMLAAITLGLGQPLNSMQLLWINLFTDIFPGLALALEPAEPDVLERPPRDPHEQIIRKQDLSRMVLESGIIGAGTLLTYIYGMRRYGAGPQASTLAFNTLTVAELLHAIRCRSNHTGLFSKTKRPVNRYLNYAVGGTLLVQLLATIVPGIRNLLGATPLGIADYLVIAAGSAGPYLINEAAKQYLPMDDGLHTPLAADAETVEGETLDVSGAEVVTG